MRSYAGGMFWKTVSDKEYLVRVTNRRGGNKSLGARTERTEAIFAEFVRGKVRCSERLSALQKTLREQSAMARAIGLGRIPVVAAEVLREIELEGFTDKNLLVVGTHAMYAYEAAAGVMFGPELMATQDIDFLWDARSRLQLADVNGEVAHGGLLAVLKRVDDTFSPMEKTPFRAVNKDGFFVDLIKQTPSPPWRRDQAAKLADADLAPSWIDQMKWLLSSEKFTATVIDQSGKPATMSCPDPRAFAVYKAWMSELKSREMVKRRRDRLQGQACAELVLDRFTHLAFSDDQLRMFPRTVLDDARERLRGDAP